MYESEWRVYDKANREVYDKTLCSKVYVMK